MKKQTRKEKAEQLKYEDDDARLEKLLDQHGFLNALGIVANDACQLDDKAEDVRRNLISMLHYLELNVKHAIESAERWRKIDTLMHERDHGGSKLSKLDALAADTRGNENERANAKAAADKLRGNLPLHPLTKHRMRNMAALADELNRGKR